MKSMEVLSKILINSTIKKKIPKEKKDYLLSVLALAALPSYVFAAKETPEKVEIKGYLIDASKLAKEAGIEVFDIDELVVTLTDSSLGELIYLGNGIYQFIASGGVLEISLVIASTDASQSTNALISLDQVLPLDGGTIDHNDFDISDFRSNIISTASSTVSVDLIGMAVAGVGVAVAMIGKSIAATGEDLEGWIGDGSLQNAQVFLDLDDDSILDWTDNNANDQWDAGEGEQWTLSAADGTYTLSAISAADIAAGTLIGQAYKVDGVSQTVDVISGSDVANIMMKADASATVITPLTSLLQAGISNDEALDVLGLEDTEIDINNFNPFSAENDGTANAIAFEKVATKLFTTVNTIAEAIDSAAGDNLDAVQGFKLAMTQVATTIGEEIAARAAIDVETAALQAIVDAAGDDATAAQITAVAESEAVKAARSDLDLTDQDTIEDIANNTVTAADALLETELGLEDTVSNEVTALIANVSEAIVNVNTAIETITDFDDDNAQNTLSIGAEELATQVKAAVSEDATMGLLNSTLTSTGINLAPVFTSSAAVTVDENQTDVVTLAATDYESDNLAYTISGTDAASFSVSNGVLTFASAPDFETKASYSLTATATETTDSNGDAIGSPNSIDQAITVTITDINEVPTVVADSVTILEDASATVISVLDNDSDPEGVTLTLASKSHGSNGTVANIGDGTVSYTPNANYNGSDTFTYTASDGTGTSEEATVTVTITAVNDDPTGSVTIAGTTKTGQTLTASNTLADDDGIGAISYQWYKDDAVVSGATDATLVLDDDDVDSTFKVKASYTDDDGTAESVFSDATSEVNDIDKAFSISLEIIDAITASTDIYSGDYVDETGTNDTDKIIKATLTADMSKISNDDADSISAGDLNLEFDWSLIEVFDWNDDTTDEYLYEELTLSSIFLTETKTSAGIDIAPASLRTSEPVLTIVDNATPSDSKVADPIPSSLDLVTIYLNPTDAAENVGTFSVAISGTVTYNAGGTEDPIYEDMLSYTTTVDII